MQIGYTISTSFRIRNSEKMYNMNSNKLISYEVLKSSETRNYNIHLLSFTKITSEEYHLFKNEDVQINLNIFREGNILFSLNLQIKETNVVEELNGKYNLQLVLVSDYIKKLMNSTKYVEMTGTSDNKDILSAYELVTKVIRQMSKDGGEAVKGYYNNAGEIKFAYPNITVPKNLNDLILFDYLFEHYPPYYLKPYFIIDDFHAINKKNNKSSYHIFLNNIIDTNGNYFLKNVKTISTYKLENYKYIKTRQLFNFEDFKKELQSTIYLKNTNAKKIFKLQPLKESMRIDNVIIDESQLSVKFYKAKLRFKKILMNYNSSIESYSFKNADIFDYTFGNVYNIQSKEFDMLPINIFYRFTKNDQDENFTLLTKVDFVKSPSNLLAN